MMRTTTGYFFMDKQKFSKLALSVPQQLDFLSKQGLIIEDPESAKEVLGVVSYYRLSGYSLPFKRPHTHNKESRQFQNDISFDKIWQLYQFDRELRLLVSDAVEKIEIAFRTALVNATCVKLNPFWYTERTHFRCEEHFDFIQKNIQTIIKSKQELFIQHYFKKYGFPAYPPLWMMIETFSFGACSKLFKNIKSKSLRQEIANYMDTHTTILESWLMTLSYTRNLCAHHARLWNRWFVNPPIIPKYEPLKKYFLTTTNFKFHVIAYIIQRLLEKVSPKSHWKQKLFALFEKYEEFPGEPMGFQNEWRNDPFWNLNGNARKTETMIFQAA